jgi:hypothetical protein
MPRRRQFAGAATSLLESFVSRNNDVGGYWAIGQLCRHALKTRVTRIDIDLLSRTISPANERLKAVVEAYARRLEKQCAAQRVPFDWLFGATISIEFEPQAGQRTYAYECAVTLTDDIRNPRTARSTGSCWPHDPAMEYRSTRPTSSAKGP